ncbi:hypothetical protein BV902_21790 [Sphingobacterium sp. B29]|nr:hypothetical protein BV902_21790 [Sphingobacterium sp. B29]
MRYWYEVIRPLEAVKIVIRKLYTSETLIKKMIQIAQQLIRPVNKYKRVCSIFHVDIYKLIIKLWLGG